MMRKITYTAKLYMDNMPLYHEGKRYCGRYAGGETFKTLSEAEEYVHQSVHRYKWLSGGYAHIYKDTYLGFVEGYSEKFVKEIEY